jgi:ketosteroid isomerase-like protein
MLRHGEGIAFDALSSLDVSLEKARSQVIAVLNRSATYRPTDRGRPREPTPPARSRFDRFTPGVRKALQLSQEEARRLNHNCIGTEHLLLGLIREGEGVAAQVLTKLDVHLNKVSRAVERTIGRGDRPVKGEIGLTPRTKKVIELAFDEARRREHAFIGTGHLLLGLVREGEGIAAGILQSLGVSFDKLGQRVTPMLEHPEFAPGPGEAAPRPAPAEPTRPGGTRMSASTPEEVHRLFAERFNAGDLDGLMELYEDGVAMAAQPGQVVVGSEAVRGALEAFLAMHGTLELKSRYVISTGELAQIVADWTLTGSGEDGKPTTLLSGAGTDVVRKQPDGSWLLIIDNPFGTA